MGGRRLVPIFIENIISNNDVENTKEQLLYFYNDGIHSNFKYVEKLKNVRSSKETCILIG